MLGIYSFVNHRKFRMYPGRLSLYSLQHGLWSRTDAFDGDYPILLYAFPDGLARGYIITLERNIKADCQEGNIKTWRVEAGRLVRQAPTFESLLDFDVTSSPSSLTVSHTHELICQSFLGERLLYKTTFRLDDRGKIVATNRSVAPWLEVWDECFLPIRHNIEKARHCVEDQSVLKKLHETYKNYCPMITSQSGDVEKGLAYIETISEDSLEKVWHISFKRKNSSWYISSIEESIGGK